MPTLSSMVLVRRNNSLCSLLGDGNHAPCLGHAAPTRNQSLECGGGLLANDCTGIYQLTQEASRTIHWHPTSNPGQSDFSHHFSKYFRSTKSSTNFWKWCVFHQFWDVSACFYKSFGWQILRQRSQRCACRFWPKRAPGSWALVLRDQRWPSRRSKRARIIIISLFQWPFGFFSTIFRHIHLLDVQKPMDFDSEVRWEGLGDSDSVPIEKRGQLTVFWTQCG